MKNAKSRMGRIAATAVVGAMLVAGIGQRMSSAAPGDSAGGPAREQGPGERGPGRPPGVQRAIESLGLTEEQQHKIAPILEEFRQKEQQAREGMLRQMKEALSADQFTKFAAAMRRPGPPPGRDEQRPSARDDQRPSAPPKEPRAVAPAAPPSAAAAPKDASQVPVTFVGGYETNPVDHGRPVVLIAAALKVESEVFREAFSNVHPAHNDGGPTEEEARRNKGVLMEALSPHGVTNDRLNEVSNYYRYNGSKGQMWRNTPATAYATIRNGAVASITITNPGSGYSSAPTVTVPGVSDVHATVKLAYGTDFSTNGSIKEITLKQ